MLDLFETPHLIPVNVKRVLDTFNEEADPYKELENVRYKVEKLGYTFEYYLDAEPYALRPIGIALNKIEGYEDDN